MLGVPRDAGQSTIKAAWRRLAREHHPDLARDDPAAAERATRRMAEINRAYAELRAAWNGDTNGDGRQKRRGAVAARADARPRPVTGRVDTTSTFRPRNTTTGPRIRHEGRPPIRDDRLEREPLRASQPTGPLDRRRQRNFRPPDPPSLDEARGRVIEFGKFHGHTLGADRGLRADVHRLAGADDLARPRPRRPRRVRSRRISTGGRASGAAPDAHVTAISIRDSPAGDGRAALASRLVACSARRVALSACGSAGASFVAAGPCDADGRARRRLSGPRGAACPRAARSPRAPDTRRFRPELLRARPRHLRHARCRRAPLRRRDVGRGRRQRRRSSPCSRPRQASRRWTSPGSRSSTSSGAAPARRPRTSRRPSRRCGDAGQVFRIDTLNDLSFQTVVIWPDDGVVRVVLAATHVRARRAVPRRARPARRDRRGCRGGRTRVLVDLVLTSGA